ncbi:MAG: IS256 family transposase [Candidatus Atribacteria bacterium]|nr:IS256 family transposase [Candidatus Atribacteria bacterium]
MQNTEYQIISKTDRRKLTDFLAQQGQLLLPALELITQSRAAVDELIDVTGRAAIEAVLNLSAQQLAGVKHPGKKAGDIRWYGGQDATIPLSDRKLRVAKPRLRKKGKGDGLEIDIPAYQAILRNATLGERIEQILMKGISTRNYQDVIPKMAETVAVSKSNISREFIEQSEQTLRQLCERKFDDKDILIVYIDGIQFGEIHVIVALGVDSQGFKQFLGLREGASENATIVKDLLTDLVNRGLKPDKRRLFVIDGSKALRKAIDEVFGNKNPVQRCRNHKIRNVMDYLPDDRKDDVQSAMKAAFKLQADDGIAKLKKLAEWLDREYPDAANSLLEGLDEMFIINRLGLPSQLRRCLGTTNCIESPYSGVRARTGRVKRWRDGQMAVRWVASALTAIEKRMKRIMGYQQLWILEAALKESEDEKIVAMKERAA